MEKGGLKVVFGSEDAHFSEIKKNGKRYVLSLYFRIHVLVRHLQKVGVAPSLPCPLCRPPGWIIAKEMGGEGGRGVRTGMSGVLSTITYSKKIPQGACNTALSPPLFPSRRLNIGFCCVSSSSFS